jgi:hypothetical protein
MGKLSRQMDKKLRAIFYPSACKKEFFAAKAAV